MEVALVGPDINQKMELALKLPLNPNQYRNQNLRHLLKKMNYHGIQIVIGLVVVVLVLLQMNVQNVEHLIIEP